MISPSPALPLAPLGHDVSKRKKTSAAFGEGEVRFPNPDVVMRIMERVVAWEIETGQLVWDETLKDYVRVDVELKEGIKS
jgi:hypothetical protein